MNYSKKTAFLNVRIYLINECLERCCIFYALSFSVFIRETRKAFANAFRYLDGHRFPSVR